MRKQVIKTLLKWGYTEHPVMKYVYVKNNEYSIYMSRINTIEELMHQMYIGGIERNRTEIKNALGM